MATQRRLVSQIFRGFVRCFRAFRRLFDSRPLVRRKREPGRSTVHLGVETFEPIFAPNSLLAAGTLAPPAPMLLPKEDGSARMGSVSTVRWLENAARGGPGTDARGLAVFVPPASATPGSSAAPGTSAISPS